MKTVFLAMLFACCLLATAQAQRPQLEVFISGVEFKIVKCYGETSTNKVTIEFVITNTNEFTKKVLTAGVPKAYDEFGTEVFVQNRSAGYLRLFGGESYLAELSSNIPVRGKVLLSQVSKASRFISALRFKSRVSSKEKHHVPPMEDCEFKLVPIEWR